MHPIQSFLILEKVRSFNHFAYLDFSCVNSLGSPLFVPSSPQIFVSHAFSHWLTPPSSLLPSHMASSQHCTHDIHLLKNINTFEKETIKLSPVVCESCICIELWWFKASFWNSLLLCYVWGPQGKFGISRLNCNYHREERSFSLGPVCKQTSNKFYAARQTIEQPLSRGPSGVRLGCFCFSPLIRHVWPGFDTTVIISSGCSRLCSKTSCADCLCFCFFHILNSFT